MARRVIILALLLTVAAFGGNRKSAIQGRAMDTEAAARRATVITGNAQGEKYSGTYEIAVNSAKLECAADTGRTVQRPFEAVGSSIDCMQADGKFSCTDTDDGKTLDGYLNEDGSFELTGPAFGELLKETGLNGSGVLKGKFTDPQAESPRSAKGELRASLRSKEEGQTITCNLLVPITIERTGSPEENAAVLNENAGELRIQSVTKKRRVSYLSRVIRTRRRNGTIQVSSEPAPGETFAATLYQDGTAKVSSVLKDSEGRTTVSIDRQACEFESDEERDGATSFAVTCPDLDATLKLPVR